MKNNFFRITLILLGIVVIYAPAQAEDGIVNAVAFHPVPANAAIAVKPWDNSEENMKTAQIIETRLQSLGYKISPQAALTLSFETKNSLGKWTPSSSNTSLEFKAEGSTASGKDAEVRLNLFSSSEGGVLNPTKKRGENILTKVSLEITLDQNNGSRLWQGEAVAGVYQTSSESVARRLTPVLLDHLGKTIRRKTVDIP